MAFVLISCFALSHAKDHFASFVDSLGMGENMNTVVEGLWPQINTKELGNSMQQWVDTNHLAKQLTGLTMENVDLGNKPPKFSNVVVKPLDGERTDVGIVADVDVDMDTDVVIATHGVKAAVNGVQAHFAPLIFNAVYGSVTSLGPNAAYVFLLNKPEFKLKDSFGLNKFFSFAPDLYQKALEAMILPDYLQLDMKTGEMTFKTMPITGRFTLSLLEGKDFPPYKYYWNKPDFYVKVLVGKEVKTSSAVQNSKTPKWNEALEFDTYCSVDEFQRAIIRLTVCKKGFWSWLSPRSPCFDAVDIHVKDINEQAQWFKLENGKGELLLQSKWEPVTVEPEDEALINHI